MTNLPIENVFNHIYQVVTPPLLLRTLQLVSQLILAGRWGTVRQASYDRKIGI